MRAKKDNSDAIEEVAVSTNNKISMSKSKDVITINIKPFLIPATIILSSIIISISLILGLNNIGNNLKGFTGNGSATQTGTTGTTPPPAQATTTASLDQIKALFKSGNMTFGDSNKKLLIAAFEDPSCPYCHIATGLNGELNKSAGSQFLLVKDGGTYVAPVPEMKKLLDSGQASFAYVYSTGHGNGKLGAQALYCAYEQGKFWEVHDLLMSSAGYSMLNDKVKNEKGNSGQLADFLAPAIDKNFMKSCLESEKYKAKVDQDDQLAASYGVSGTPGFFLNDKNFAGAYNWTDMKSIADAALK